MFNYVRTPIAGVFEKPSAQAKRVTEVLYGMDVAVSDEKENGYVKIQTCFGVEGWIEACVLLVSESERKGNVIVSETFADVMRQPLPEAETLVTLMRGSKLLFIGDVDDAGWVQVRLVDGTMGYLRERSLMPFMDVRAQSRPSAHVLRGDLMDTALEYLGVGYRVGGRSVQGMDTAGLMSTIFAENGILLPPLPDDPSACFRRVERTSAEKGDLLFYDGQWGFYLGGDRFILAACDAVRYGVAIGTLLSVPQSTTFWSVL